MADRVIFHVDVNSAFLSFEAVYRLQHGATVDLRTIPSAVAGAQATRHGIILAKSIPTKKYGVKTGEAIWEAKKKCPDIVIIPPNYYIYMQCHDALVELLREYSDKVQVFSIDECFMDMTGMKIMGEPLDVANRIRERIKNELGYTVSIGISTNKLLAKMASDMKKPDAVITLYPYEIPEKLWPLPIEDLYLVGPATGPKLRNMGIVTIGDLAKWDKELLRYKFKSFADVLWDYANGIEDSLIAGSVSSIIKGIGNSMTAHYDVVDKQDAHLMLLSLVETVGMRLRHSGFSCRVISVSPRKADDLRWYSHQRKIMVPTDNTNEIYEHCVSLFDECWKGEPLRGMGIRTSDLHTSDCIQLSLFSKDLEKQRNIDKAVDQIRKRYGPTSIIRSSFLCSGLAPLQGGVSEDTSFPVMTSIL